MQYEWNENLSSNMFFSLHVKYLRVCLQYVIYYGSYVYPSVSLLVLRFMLTYLTPIDNLHFVCLPYNGTGTAPVCTSVTTAVTTMIFYNATRKTSNLCWKRGRKAAEREWRVTKISLTLGFKFIVCGTSRKKVYYFYWNKTRQQHAMCIWLSLYLQNRTR